MQTCRTIGCRGDCDTLMLLVSEVATNALIHGAGQVRVRVHNQAPRVRVEISDDSDTMPALRDFDRNAKGGRGIALIDALAHPWAPTPSPAGRPSGSNVTDARRGPAPAAVPRARPALIA